MKILALIGSPRKRGNTSVLVDAVLEEDLHDHDIRHCMDCRACKAGK